MAVLKPLTAVYTLIIYSLMIFLINASNQMNKTKESNYSFDKVLPKTKLFLLLHSNELKVPEPIESADTLLTDTEPSSADEKSSKSFDDKNGTQHNWHSVKKKSRNPFETNIKCKDSDQNQSSIDCNTGQKLPNSPVNNETNINSLNNSQPLNQKKTLIGFKNTDEQSIKQFVKISNSFAIKFYGFMSEVYPNFMFAPISLSLMLALLLRASTGHSYKELSKTLDLNNWTVNMTNLQDSVEHTLSYLTIGLNSMDGIELQVNNGICVRDGTKVIANFLHDSNKYFNTKIKAIDFELGSKRTQTKIQKWIEQNSKSKLINTRINLEPIPDDTNLIVINSLYLSVVTNFANSLLIKSDFYAFGSRIITTQFFQRADTHNITSSKVFKSSILEIPINSDDNQKRFSLIIVLPNTNHSLESVERVILDKFDRFLQEMSNMTVRTVNVMIPKEFNRPDVWRLDRILPHIGIKSIFQLETSLLTKISRLESHHITRIYHESLFDFNPLNNQLFHNSKNPVPEGNTTQVVIESEFIANRPFLYMIIERKSSALILMAKINII